MDDPTAEETAVAAAKERFGSAQRAFAKTFPLGYALDLSEASTGAPDALMVRRALYLAAQRASGESPRLATRACEAILLRFPESDDATGVRIAILPHLLNRDGSPARAVRRLRDLVAVAPTPERPVLRLHLADALAMVGDMTAARSELQAVVSVARESSPDDAAGLEWAIAGAENRLRLLGSTIGPITVTGNLVGSGMPAQRGWMVLHFWEPWCSPCVRELPEFDGLAASLSGAAVMSVGITADSHGSATGVADAAAVCARTQLKCPMVVVDAVTTEHLGVASWPVTLVIDPDRVVRFASFSSGDLPMVEHAVRTLLALRWPGLDR